LSLFHEDQKNDECETKLEFFPSYLVEMYVYKREPQVLDIADQMRDIKTAITNELAFYSEKKKAKRQAKRLKINDPDDSNQK